VKFIGIVFADNWICDGYVAAVSIKPKSLKFHTSMCPPIFKMENVLPKTTFFATETVNEL
jgi:hypothetical protein